MLENFGLYRERTGALHVITETPAGADAAFSQLVRIARGIWSMPPDHGAAIVHGILADAALRTAWRGSRRHARADLRPAARWWQLQEHCPRRDFSFITTQCGMFSFFGINTAQVRELRARHHVYMTDDSRINIAGLRQENLSFARNRTGVLANFAFQDDDAVRGLHFSITK